MRLTILGAGAATPHAGGACSGYLVEEGDTRVVLDCGNGVLGNLMKVADFREVTAIVISHWHADHWFDLVPYRYGIQLSMHPVPRKPQLFLPPGGIGTLEGAMSFVDPSGEFFRKVFPTAEYHPDQGLAIGPLRLSFARTQHVVPTWAVRISGGPRSLAYSSDSGPSQELETLAHRADLFLCEATLQGPGDQSPRALHLSAVQAGQIAARAGVGTLLLTHIWPELDPARSVAEARQFFSDVVAVEELQRYEVG